MFSGRQVPIGMRHGAASPHGCKESSEIVLLRENSRGGSTFHIPIQMLRTILEEIVAKCTADFEKQRHGGPLCTEDLVEVLRGAVHLLCQPHSRTPLARQFRLDHLSQMQVRNQYLFVFLHGFCLFSSVCVEFFTAHKKKVGPLVCQHPLSRAWTPRLSDAEDQAPPIWQ